MTYRPQHRAPQSQDRRSRWTWGAAALLAVAVPATVVPIAASIASASSALPALAPGFVAVAAPASGTFTITGRAWGHRIGMSQVGAQYAGRAGFSTAAILSHYYPGTTLTALPAAQWSSVWPGTPAGASRPVLRVRVDANGASPLAVTATAGLGLVVAGKATPLPVLKAASATSPVPVPARWRLAPATVANPRAGVLLQYAVASGPWTTTGAALPLGTGFSVAAPGTGVRVELPDGRTRTEPGVVVLTNDHPGSLQWMTVSQLDPESYLGSVVAAEIGPSSPPATLGAQAVAARTYAARLASFYGAKRNWDVCSTSQCQAYLGVATGTVAAGPTRDVSRVPASTTKAVAATHDQLLLYGGRPALTMFAAANGGFTVSGGLPYLPAQPDPWDKASGSASSVWTATLPASVLARLLPAGDHLVSIAMGARDGHGDLGGTASVVLLDSEAPDGTMHRTTTTPAALRALWPWPQDSTGLRSTWFAVVPVPGATVPTPTPTPSPTATARPAAPAAPANPVIVRRGSRGSDVVLVQRLLKVSPLGYFGPLTQARVTAWQRAHRLPATGVVDLRTWTAMHLPARPGATPAKPAPVATKPDATTPVVTKPATKPAVAKPAATDPVIVRRGSRGSDVVLVQRLLRVSPLGYFGPLTQARVTAWQRAHRLPSTGVVDLRTWTAMHLPARPGATPPKPAPAPTPSASSARSSATSARTNPVLLQRGSRGPVVLAVQRLLHVSSLGYYGPLTQAAVARWQRAHRLPATGRVDLRTWTAMHLLVSPTTSTSARNPVLLRPGSNGQGVVLLQRLLHVSPVGHYGPLTRAAVARWQRAHRLPDTGLVDLRTWDAMHLPISLPARS